jgi:hypothetical protein
MTKPSASLVKATWDATVNPSERKVEAILVKQGYDINSKAIQRLKKNKWAEPSVKKAERTLAVVKKKAPAQKAKAQTAIKPATNKEVAESEKLDLTALTVRRLARIDELYLRTVSENQATMQQAGLIAGIVVAEELAAMIGTLTILAPGDVARLLHAITEASQVKHVGGGGKEVPESGDPRVIDGTVNKNPVSEAIAEFKKKNGLG